MFSEVNAERRFCCYERLVGVPDDVEEAQPLFARATLMCSTILENHIRTAKALLARSEEIWAERFHCCAWLRRYSILAISTAPLSPQMEIGLSLDQTNYGMSLQLTLFEYVHLMPCAKLPLSPKGFRMHIHFVKHGKGPRISPPRKPASVRFWKKAYSASLVRWRPV